MTKACYLLVGDTHGDMSTAAAAVRAAKKHGVKTLVQLGDFGFLWPGRDQTRALANRLCAAGMVMWFIDGNHDDHPALRKRVAENKLAKELIYLQRGSVTTLPNGLRVGALGGAASIDRMQRVPGFDWWPEEMPTQEEVERLEPCDILLTHDSPIKPPDLLPWGGLSPIVKADLVLSRQRVADALARTGARRLYHGHYHRLHRTQIGTAGIVGLANNGEPDSMLFVDEQFEPVGPAFGAS